MCRCRRRRWTIAVLEANEKLLDLLLAVDDVDEVFCDIEA